MRSILVVAGAAVLLAGFSSSGFADAANPTVADYVAACSSVRHVPHQRDSDAFVDCQNKIVFAAMDPTYCVPPKETQPDDMLQATTRWLKDRPDMAKTEAEAGILAALKALYCH